MSDFVYPADFEALREELRRETLRAALAPQQDTPPAAPAAPSYSDRELGLQILQRERGLDELEAFRALERDPNVLTELAPEIERLRDFRTRTDTERIERQRAATPEAKALAAAEALDREARDVRRVAGARALIAADLEGHGVTEAMLPDLTPAEVLALAGLVQADDPADSIEANVAAAEGSDAA